MTSTVATRNAVPKGGVVLFAVTAVVITVTLALGSTVCATDASASCPNWPGCYVGRLTPLDATQPWVEFIHRVISASIGLLAVASIIVGMVYRHADKLLVALPIVALLGALTSGVFGMMTIKWGINSVEASFDLLAAIISMGAMWRAYFVACKPRSPWIWSGRTKLGIGAVAFLIVGHFFAVQVACSGSLTRCMGWAMFVRGAGDGPLAGWVAQQAIMGIGMVLAIVFLVVRWGRRSGWDILCAVLVIIELVSGVLIAVNGSSHGLGTLHAVPAVLILCLTMTATMRSARG